MKLLRITNSERGEEFSGSGIRATDVDVPEI